MGKTNKKVKNDRINAIRKQYDAFLEEDKKRRERNEYILGKLDKMRLSTALVPITTQANYHMELNSSEIFKRPNNVRMKPDIRDSYASHFERQNVSSGILNKPLDELRILKEISKKYILIPKRTTPFENDYICSKDVIDDDWKSKYNILDDLKKLEKEGQSDPVISQYNDDNYIHNNKQDLYMASNISKKQLPILADDPNGLDNPIRNKNNELTTVHKFKNSSVEHDKSSKQVNFNVPEINSQDSEQTKIPMQIASTNSNEGIKVHKTQSVHNAIQERIINPRENITEKEKYNSESNEKDFDHIKNVNFISQICEIKNINQPTEDQENVNLSNYNISIAETNKYVVPEIIKADMSNAAISDQINTNVEPQDTLEHLEETIHLDRNIDNQKDTSKIRDLTSTESVELYEDVDNNPEIVSIVVDESSTDKPTHHDPGHNTIPVDLESIQHPEQVEHESEINAFEAEQKEMFYSEQTDVDTYAYNQAEGNTAEYIDGYEQNDQYAYYEGVQQEQAYATNINEHEESTERYDPHYNQQYEGSYENQQPDNTVRFENTNTFEQQQFQTDNRQFENIASYESQEEIANLYQQENVSNENEVQDNVLPPQDDQIYDQHLYSEQPGIQEDIEQQLIAEEGYIENSPVIPDEFQKENEDEIKKVIDTTAPEEPNPDPKLA